MIGRALRYLRSHPAAGVAVLLAAGASAVLMFIYFAPHKLFIDERVAEPIPSPPSTSEEGGGGPTTAVADFRSLEHETTGRAMVTLQPDGSGVLSLLDFRTSNGPDLRVYLSAGDDDAFFGKQYGEEFVELGKLKGNIGDQNYDIPPGIDLSRYKNAVIWCKRFRVGFGVATFDG